MNIKHINVEIIGRDAQTFKHLQTTRQARDSKRTAVYRQTMNTLQKICFNFSAQTENIFISLIIWQRGLVTTVLSFYFILFYFFGFYFLALVF